MQLRGYLLPVVLFALTASLLAQPNPVSFAPAVTYPSGGGENTYSVAVADFNGDGKMDLVLAVQYVNGVGSVAVLLGNGDGTFKQAVTYPSGGAISFGVAASDVNGDGKPDVVVTNLCITSDNCSNSLVGVLLGNGDGTFKQAVTYSSGGLASYTVALVDLNGDGKADVVVSNLYMDPNNLNEGSVVGVLLGNGDGTFQGAVTYGAGAGAYTAAIADFNRDGKPDVVVANTWSGSVAVLLGKGDGTLLPAVMYASGGTTPIAVAAADVNGDGKSDVLVTHNDFNIGANDRVGVLLGNGDGTFQAAAIYLSGGFSTTSVVVADVNMDGRPDLVVGNQCNASNNCSNGMVAGVLLGNGDGTFQNPVTYLAGGSGFGALAVQDVNGDGMPDLLTGIVGEVSVLINTTPLPYKAFVQPPINADNSSIFKANRGVIPVKFSLTKNNTASCDLPTATIAVTRTAGGTTGAIDEASYLSPADNSSNFRITACQYVYNLAASALGVGTYDVDIKTNGVVVGNAVFALK
jgi:hypothetical protein